MPADRSAIAPIGERVVTWRANSVASPREASTGRTSTGVTAEAIPLLRKLDANAPRLHQLTERLVRLEGEVDRHHAQGLRALFKACGDNQTMRFIVDREIYSHLERIADRFEDIANEIQGLGIDHA